MNEVTGTHTLNFYRKFSGPSGTTGTLEHAPLNRSVSIGSGVPVSSRTDSGTSTPEHRAGVALFVSTALESWITPQPDVFTRDVQINDTAYRRLDPDYYAWLRSKMRLAKMSVDAGRLGQDEFQQLRCRFNTLHEWAVGHYGESRLLDAIRNLDARDYQPPVVEPDTPRRAPQSVESVSAEALALVDEIRDRALAVGWNHDRLYGVPETQRSGIAVSGGLVCYLRDGWRIREVTRQSIEIIGPPPLEVRQCFYNPDVDRHWIRKVGRPQEFQKIPPPR